MIKVQQLRDVKTSGDLIKLMGQFSYEIGHRGGNLSYSSKTVSEKFNVPANLLPRNFGVYCNYLGGGIRGQIQRSTFSDTIDTRKSLYLIELTKACERVYKSIEDEDGLNDTEDAEGETNWDAVATAVARKVNIKSAY